MATLDTRIRPWQEEVIGRGSNQGQEHDCMHMTEAKRFLPESTSLARPWTSVGTGEKFRWVGRTQSANAVLGTSSPGSVAVNLSHRHLPLETDILH